MLDYGIAGKIALVTGGGSGIGEATCSMLAGMGARVGVIDLVPSDAERVAAEIRAAGGDAVAFGCDVGDPDLVDATVAAVVDRFGRLDIAVNNAGTGLPATRTADLATEDWRRVVTVNLDGTFFCMRAELRQMQLQGSGSIVNVSSVLGAVGSEAGSSAYTASKHAVVGITRNAALEYAGEGIRVNVIGPGYVLTPLVERMITQEIKDRRLAETPIGRLGRPEEIASMVAWLGSDAASFVTGGYYAVDGGFLAR